MKRISSQSVCLSISLSISLALGAGCTKTPQDTMDLAQAPDLSAPEDLSGLDLTGVDLMPEPERIAVFGGSDFTSGALSTLNLKTMALRKALDVLDGQPVIRIFQGKVYVLGQSKGTLRIYDPALDYKNPLEHLLKHPEVPAAKGNPYDIYVDAPRNRAYVSLNGAYGAFEVDGNHALGILDLSNLSAGIKSFVPVTTIEGDPDKNPEAAKMMVCGDNLYLLLQNLNRNLMYRPAGPGRIAVVDLVSQKLTKYINLVGQNPVDIRRLGSNCQGALVAHADNQIAGTITDKGGLEEIDLVMGTSKGMLMSAKDLGGNVSAIDTASNGTDRSRLFVDLVVNNAGRFDHTVYRVNADTKMKTAILGPMNYVPGISVVGERLLVLSAGIPEGDQLKPGLYLGKADGMPLGKTPLDVGLPPVSLDVF